MHLKPTALNKDQALKVFKTILYIAGSGAVAALASWIATDDAKELLGFLWPVFNVGAVFLKQVFTRE